jgi:hypothetical protein
MVGHAVTRAAAASDSGSDVTVSAESAAIQLQVVKLRALHVVKLRADKGPRQMCRTPTRREPRNALPGPAARTA